MVTGAKQQEIKMEEENVKDYWKSFPEAPFSDTFRWIDGNGFEHMVTIRGWTFQAMYQTIAKAEAFILESGGRTAALQPAPKPAQAPAPSTESATANAVGTSMQIAKIKVTPEVKDGVQRILVELFAIGHEWPDIKAFYSTGEQAHTAFSGVTDLNFNEAGEYQINCIADYRLSEKKNSKGNPYKNLVSVRTA
jgi:hypothetical protein